MKTGVRVSVPDEMARYRGMDTPNESIDRGVHFPELSPSDQRPKYQDSGGRRTAMVWFPTDDTQRNRVTFSHKATEERDVSNYLIVLFKGRIFTLSVFYKDLVQR